MTEVTFSTAAKVVAGLGGLLLVAILLVLTFVLLSLEGTRDEITSTRAELEQTDRRVQRLGNGFAPVLDAVKPIVSRASKRQVRRTAGRVAGATAEIPVLADDVRSTVGIVSAIAGQVEGGDLAGSLTAVRGLAGTLVPAGRQASALLAALDVPGSRSLTVCEDRLKLRAPSQPGQIGCLLRLVPNFRALLDAQRRILTRSRRIQDRTRSLTRANLEALRESLAIQRQILVHVRSLDTKSGGTVPLTSNP